MNDDTESAGCYHAHIGALALDHHVRRHGGAMQHKVNVCRRYAGDLAHFHDTLDDTDGLIRRGRRYFVDEDLLTRTNSGLFQDNVGERTPNINADTYHDLLPL
jgi:hypothetical protein